MRRVGLYRLHEAAKTESISSHPFPLLREEGRHTTLAQVDDRAIFVAVRIFDDRPGLEINACCPICLGDGHNNQDRPRLFSGASGQLSFIPKFPACDETENPQSSRGQLSRSTGILNTECRRSIPGPLSILRPSL